MQDVTNGAKVILAWLLAILLLFAITRTRVGYTIVYYGLWLGVLMLVLGSYQRIDALLSLVQAPGPISETEKPPETKPPENRNF